MRAMRTRPGDANRSRVEQMSGNAASLRRPVRHEYADMQSSITLKHARQRETVQDRSRRVAEEFLAPHACGIRGTALHGLVQVEADGSHAVEWTLKVRASQPPT